MVQDVLHIHADGEVVFVTAIAAKEAAARAAKAATAARSAKAAATTIATIAAIIQPLTVCLPIVVRRWAEAEGLRDVQIDQHHSRPIAEVARDDLLARQRVRIEVAKWCVDDDRITGLSKRRAV